MKLMRILLPILVLGILAFAPHPALAANATFLGPIIPEQCNCPGGAPDFGCVLAVIQNLMNFAISIGVVIFVLVAAYAGLLWMFSPMNAQNRELGRSILMNAVIGLLIALCAWLIVDFVMKTLYNERFGPWYSILGSGEQCLIVHEPPVGSAQGAGGPGTVVGSASGVQNGAYNASVAANYATSHAAGHSTGQCAQYVRTALAAGGLTSFNANHPTNAADYGPFLQNAGFAATSGAAQVGDVVVFARIAGHPSGHIAIWNGSHWVSDFVQQNMDPTSDGDYAHSSHTIYHHP